MDRPYKLLIIDDNNETLKMLSAFFTKKKYDVKSATNGLDGLKYFEADSSSFDLVITDLVMPSISGVAVISILKKKRPDMPIIAITGWGEQPEALAKEAMADLILQKPLELIDLEEHIVKLLGE